MTDRIAQTAVITIVVVILAMVVFGLYCIVRDVIREVRDRRAD